MIQYINKAAVVAEIERRIKEGEEVIKEVPSSAILGLIQAYKNVLSFLDTIEVKEEPVNDDLEEAATKYAQDKYLPVQTAQSFKAGAEWQINNLWKPAAGEDLPEIGREVIALLDNGKAVFAHRPPEYWNGKNIITNEVTRYEPKRYDKGGWNQPNVKWWLDLDLPKMEE